MKKLFASLSVVSQVLATIVFLVSCGPEEDPVSTPTEISVTNVSLSQSSINLFVGETVKLVADITPGNATDRVVTWSSSDLNVATVDKGEVYAFGEGTATITATVGGKSATCVVTIKKFISVESVTLDHKEIVLGLGEKIQLVPTIKPDNALNNFVSWKIDDPEIASIDAEGIVTAFRVGETVITAKADEVQATCKVTVVDSEKEIRDILMEFYNAMGGPNWTNQKNWGTDERLKNWDCVDYDPSDHSLTLVFIVNGLKGAIPDCIGKLTDLKELRIEGEPGVTGSLPQSFSKLVNLEFLSISRTSITSLPDIFSAMTKLKTANFSLNRELAGQIPESLALLENITQVSISGCGFTGTPPESWARVIGKVSISLAGNHFSGEIPAAYLQGDVTKNLVGTGLLNQYGDGFDISNVDLKGLWPEAPVNEIITGQPFTFADVVKKNKYTVYLSWAPWSTVSKTLLDKLLDFYKKHHQEGLEIIATVMTAEDVNQVWQDLDTQVKSIKDNGYDIWYNCFFYDYFASGVSSPSATPSAEVYDSEGSVLFSSFSNYPDPVRKRYGKAVSVDLMPFLESLFDSAGKD